MGKVEMPCDECGKPTYKWPSQAAAAKYGVFCNIHCLGKFRTKILVGDKAANFKMGFTFDRKYICVKANWHPQAMKDGYQYLHRIIMEARLGRYLDSNEIVHHKDEDPMNNHWSNLEITNRSEHAIHHNSDKKRDKNGRFKDERTKL